MLALETKPSRSARQIGKKNIARIANTALDCPKGHALLGSRTAAQKEALLAKFLTQPVDFDLDAELQRCRIDRRAARQQSKVERLDDDAVVADRVADILADDKRTAQFIRRVMEARNEGEDRPFLAEVRAATGQWVEAAAEGVDSGYTDAMPYRPGEDRATAEELIERFMRSRSLAASETIRVAPKKIKREDVADIVDIFEEAQRRGDQHQHHAANKDGLQ